MYPIGSFKSRANKPNRVFISSNDGIANENYDNYSTFECQLPTPILGACKTQILRATIPNAMVNIPDYALTFWYFKLATPTTARATSNLYCVRIMPTNWYAPTSPIANMPVNSYYATPTDLANALNLASANDSATYNVYYGGVNDVAFTWNSVTKKMVLTGLNTGVYYEPAGYTTLTRLATNFNGILVPAFGSTTTTGATYQPYIPEYSLNLRAGFARPLNPVIANQYCLLGGVGITSDSYPNLVFTQCYYVYANICAGSSLGSNGTHNLLSVVPSSAGQLAVTNYTALTINMLTKVPQEIYNIKISITDDNNVDVVFPDSAVINIELAFKYPDEE